MMLKTPSFVADAMLGSVARKLRIFGFDTIYAMDADDDEILKLGIEQDRIILTADKELFKRLVKSSALGVLVSGESDIEDLVHILSKNGIRFIDFDIGSRCAMCNGLLEEKKLDQIKNCVPDKVAANHSEFYQCKVCTKVYWKGGHLKRIRMLARTIDGKLGRTGAT